MKLYGSVINRMAEQRPSQEIFEGMGATQYLYSDRNAYEVVKVINQKHCFIRRVDAIRTDNNGMSECQEYRFESNEHYRLIEMVYRYHAWYELRIFNGQKIYEKWDGLVFGVQEEYFDYSF